VQPCGTARRAALAAGGERREQAQNAAHSRLERCPAHGLPFRALVNGSEPAHSQASSSAAPMADDEPPSFSRRAR